MTTFSLYLWKEWREHRAALLAVAGIALVGVPAAAASPLVGDPLFPLGAAVTVAVVALLAVGGELLAERREGGVAWLDRLPSGLSAAFWSKLVVLATTTAAAAGLGLAIALAVAWKRGRFDAMEWSLAGWALAFAAALAAWTFACSAWSSRSVVALFAAGLVLAGPGAPAWYLATEAFHVRPAESAACVAMTLGGAGASAWLAYVTARRRGRRLGNALALAVALAAFAPTWAFAAWHVRQRGTVDPLEEDFQLGGAFVTEDGRVAFAVGSDGESRWRIDRLPAHWFRVDLEGGTAVDLGQVAARSHAGVLSGARQLALPIANCQDALVFDLQTGAELRSGQRGDAMVASRWRGMGEFLPSQDGAPDVIRDPFRERDFLARDLADDRCQLMVRPGRWLCRPHGDESWSWTDPERGVREPTGWPARTRPLVLFRDGRILVAHPELGLVRMHPERGEVHPLDTHGLPVDSLWTNWNGGRAPTEVRSPRDFEGTIVLKSYEDAWLVLDAEATSARRIAVPQTVMLLQRVGDDAAVVHDWETERLERLDLIDGERTALWPLRRE